MKITKAEVDALTLLARLELPPGEKETFTGQMDTILAYVPAAPGDGETGPQGVKEVALAAMVECGESTREYQQKQRELQ